MRYSRFKQQMEGKATTPRRSKPAGGSTQNKKNRSNPNNPTIKPDLNASADPFLDDKSNIKLEDGGMGVGDGIATPASDQLSQMENAQDGTADGSPGVEQLSPTQNAHRTPNLSALNMSLNGGMSLDSDNGATAAPPTQRRVKSEPRDDDDAVMYGAFTPPLPRPVHVREQDQSQETDTDADGEADAEVDAAFELDMHTHSAHAEQLLGGNHSHNHNHGNASSFSSGAHHSFVASQGQEAMMSFSSSGGGDVMYAPAHRQAGMMQNQSFPQHQHMGGYLVMPYGEGNLEGPHTMMAMGGGGMVGNNGGPYQQGGVVPGMVSRPGMKMEERWGDEYCT